MSLATVVLLLIKVSIMLSVFAIGLKATFADTIYLFRCPGKLLRAFVSMFVIMPLFALLIYSTFELNPPLKLALVALSVSPLPPILPNKAMKAGGREDYTIGLLTATAVLSVVVIPLTMELVERISGVPLQMRARDVAALMLSSVLAPLLLGMGVRYLWSSFAERAAKPIAIVGMAVLILACLPILFTSVRAILTYVGDGTLIALSSFALVGMIVGHLLGGPDLKGRAVLAIATSSRHPAVALAIGHANFPNQKLGPFVLVYLVLSAILATPYLSWARSHSTTTTSETQVEA
jgi:BASS family bile acid:Na+ symporter